MLNMIPILTPASSKAETTTKKKINVKVFMSAKEPKNSPFTPLKTARQDDSIDF